MVFKRGSIHCTFRQCCGTLYVFRYIMYLNILKSPYDGVSIVKVPFQLWVEQFFKCKCLFIGTVRLQLLCIQYKILLHSAEDVMFLRHCMINMKQIDIPPLEMGSFTKTHLQINWLHLTFDQLCISLNVWSNVNKPASSFQVASVYNLVTLW